MAQVTGSRPEKIIRPGGGGGSASPQIAFVVFHVAPLQELDVERQIRGLDTARLFQRSCRGACFFPGDPNLSQASGLGSVIQSGSEKLRPTAWSKPAQGKRGTSAALGLVARDVQSPNGARQSPGYAGRCCAPLGLRSIFPGYPGRPSCLPREGRKALLRGPACPGLACSRPLA